MYKTYLTESAEKDFKSLTKKNNEIENLILNKLGKLQNININEAMKNKEVGIIEGLSSKLLQQLKENNYDPFVYEYRKFPNMHPFRVMFIKNAEAIIILWINHHKAMKDNFNKILSEKISSIIF